MEDPRLGGEQPVHRRLRNIRQVADGLDRGCGVAAFEEKGPRGFDDRSASQAGTCLTARAARGAAAPCIGAHSCETNTLKMRVLVSITRWSIDVLSAAARAHRSPHH